jgi:ketosteroid isomerase-like protein
MSQENVEILWRMVEIWNLGDVEGVGALMAPDVECFPAERELTPRSFRGREAFVAYATEWLADFDEYVLVASEYLDVSECVIVVGRVIGRGRGSGAEVSADDAWLYRFRDGMVVEYRECGTREEALEAAGPRE